MSTYLLIVLLVLVFLLLLACLGASFSIPRGYDPTRCDEYKDHEHD